MKDFDQNNSFAPETRKPFYKKWQFYLIAASGFLACLFLSLLFSVVILRWANPPVTNFMLLEDWHEIESERYNLRSYWVPYDDIPYHMKWAVIASEDQLFHEHRGFDMESIREAWQQRQSGERNRGASTITQQVAKNLYLWPEHSFFRKGLEAAITVLIELFWPKERIMEVYLNIAEFGPGIFGIGKAAETFWGTEAENLEPDMAARMAAVLPSPKRMRVEPPSPFAEQRSGWILRQMTHLTGIAYVETEPVIPDEDPDPMLLEAEYMLDNLLNGRTPAEPVLENENFYQMELPDTLLSDTVWVPAPINSN